MTRALLVLLCLASLADARTRKPTRPRAKMAAPKLAVPTHAPDPRRVLPGEYKPGTLLYVDVEYGLFGRGHVAGMVDHEKAYVLKVGSDAIRVWIPEPVDLLRRVQTYAEFDVDEAWLERRGERWELMGRRGSKRYLIDGVKPREVSR